MNIQHNQKFLYNFFAIICILCLTSCAVNNSWMGLVGRWQDSENPSFEIEFTKEGQYIEYLLGEKSGLGNFQPDQNSIKIHYLSPCGGGNQVSCDFRLGFILSGNILTITDNQGNIRFTKVGN